LSLGANSAQAKSFIDYIKPAPMRLLSASGCSCALGSGPRRPLGCSLLLAAFGFLIASRRKRAAARRVARHD